MQVPHPYRILQSMGKQKGNEKKSLNRMSRKSTVSKTKLEQRAWIERILSHEFPEIWEKTFGKARSQSMEPSSKAENKNFAGRSQEWMQNAIQRP